MKPSVLLLTPVLAGLAPLAAKEAAADEAAKAPAEKPAELDPEMEREKQRLTLENALREERVKAETAGLRAELARLKAEKELLAERLELAKLQRQAEREEEIAEAEIEEQRLARSAAIAKARAEALGQELKAVEAEAGIEVARLKGEIARLETVESREGYADAEPEYLAKPLRDDGMLVISDRRIPLNGPILSQTANYVTERIHYFNNKNRELPIFIVIDDSPGGSVMAGYRILKAMDASDAPVHVVVKSFAASMAAGITTLAEESYAYPNAIILHHEISGLVFGRLNLTQQEEFLKESRRWWKRLAEPVADKMGISTEEFVKRMYEHSSSGDWSEFAEEAKELKWVNHVVAGIEETSFVRNPDADKKGDESPARTSLEEELDDDGRPVTYLPRLNPKDVYFLYNPDGYYRLR